MVVLYDDGNDEIELPEDFEPSCHDAIVGWARQNYHHCEFGGTFARICHFFWAHTSNLHFDLSRHVVIGLTAGNKKLRDVVYRYVPQYRNAQSKTEKGQVIAAIITQIRHESPTRTGLVRQSPKTLRWSYIGLEKAKDKIGHALRKASQEYGRQQARQKGYTTPFDPLPHTISSSSSSLLDSTTTATRSMSSSDSDNEDEDAAARNGYRLHTSGGYNYPPAPNGSSYAHNGYHGSAMYNYSAAPTHHMMYYHPRTEASLYPHPMAYPAHSSDLVAASSYHHQHYYYSQPCSQYSYPDIHVHAHEHYDPRHIPNDTGYYHAPKGPIAHGVPSYPGHSVVTPSNSYHTKAPPSAVNHIPILPKQEYTFTPEGPDPWTRAVQEATFH